MRSTPHINPATPITPATLLPEDPLRVEFTAETYLEGVQQLNAVHNMPGCTGTYRGTPVPVMGSGMGIPLIPLYAHELTHESGCMRLVCVGAHGALQPDADLYDVVVVQAAYSNLTFPDQYQIPGSYAPVGSFRLTDDVVHCAHRADMPIHVGSIPSSDTLYNANPTFNEAWQRMGVLAAEMESTGLYATAAHMSVEVVGIFIVSGSPVTGEITDAQACQTSFTTMMELALPLAQL